MHYCDKNFRTKKALKDAVAARVEYFKALKDGDGDTDLSTEPARVTVYNPEAFSGERPTPANGWVCVGGPHYPEAHVWYAEVQLMNNEVVKVK